MEIDLTQRLPDDVLAAVLRCLPPRSLAAARCVCKAWNAIIDARRLLDLFPPSLAGLFINFFDFPFSEFFFRPPRPGHTAVSGKLHHYTNDEDDDTVALGHCNGLLLFYNYVVNPATRSWAPLPPPPPSCSDELIRGRRYIVFDPAISPHYEVLITPSFPWLTPGLESEPEEVLITPSLPWLTPGLESEPEWPPSPFIMLVFSSATRSWEERSFARRGCAMATVPDLQVGKRLMEQAAYWRGELYVFDVFVMRISLSNCTYQAIKPPIDDSTSEYQDIRFGRSENGVYFASIDDRCQLRVWILDCDEMEWVLKHDNTIDHMLSRGMYDPQVQGPWILEDINYSLYHSTTPIDMKQVVEEDEFEWDSDNENTLDTRRRVRNCDEDILILGFHPYKEVIFLNESTKRGLAYHLNSSKLEDLGSICPKDYNCAIHRTFVEQSFPYTPCWIGKLPGSC